MATPTELARDALSKVDILRAEFDFLRSQFEKLSLNEVRERMAVFEDRLTSVERKFEELRPTKAESEEMGAVKNRLSQLEDNKKLGDRRAFQFIMLFFGGVITLTVQIAILFLKK